MTDKTPMEKRCDAFRKKLKASPFASIVPGRSPVFKVHAGLGRAKSAVGYDGPSVYDPVQRYYRYGGVRGGEIYQRAADGTWELLYRVEEGTMPDDLPWNRDEKENDCE